MTENPQNMSHCEGRASALPDRAKRASAMSSVTTSAMTPEERDALILRLCDLRIADYLSLLAIDVDAQRMTALVNSDENPALAVGESVPYGAHLKLLASKLEGAAADYFMQLSDMAYVKQAFAVENGQTFSYRSRRLPGQPWVLAELYVVERHGDGVPATILLGFSLLDAMGVHRHGLRAKLQDALETVSREAQRSELLLEIISAARWSFKLDENGTISRAYISSSALPLIEKEIVEKPLSWLRKVHEDDRASAEEAFFAALRDYDAKEPHIVVFRIWDDDMNLRWVKSAGKRVRHDDGTSELLGISVDITDQVEEQKRYLLGAIPLSADILIKENIGLWALELDKGRHPRMYANNAMLSALGLSEHLRSEEIYDAWQKGIAQSARDMVADALDKMASGEHVEVRFPWQRLDGSTIMARAGGIRNYEYAKGIRLEGTHQDVTQTVHFDEEKRRRSQLLEKELMLSQLRVDLLEYIADTESDFTGALQFFSQRILETVGCDQVVFRGVDGSRIALNAEGVQDIPWEICQACDASQQHHNVHDDDANRLVLAEDDRYRPHPKVAHPQCPVKSALVHRIYSDGERVGTFAIHYIKQSHAFTAEEQATMKTLVIYLGLFIGRIKQKRAERAKLEAEAANEAKTEFLFRVSHDIRTPMNAILGYADIAQRHEDDLARVGDYLAKIKTSGEHLLALINDILEMSRIEAGKMAIACEPLDIRSAIANVSEMGNALALSKSVQFTVEAEDVTDPFIYADELHVNQVLINLISNAIKYTPEGGHVTYRAEQLGPAVQGQARFRFTISDDGVGMSKDFLGHLFEAFAREETALSPQVQGVGLGLSIVKNIVDMMGGTVSVESTLGEGSVFTVELPFGVLDDQAVAAYCAAQKREEARCDNTEDLAGMRVLLAEDNAMNREIATEMLQDAGLSVEQAEDGMIAVQRVIEAPEGTYDFVLMDIQMPVMNGYEATAAIRALPQGAGIPIVALSANAFEEDRAASLAAGMNAHVAKPLDVGELLDTLRRLRQ